jgi:hypothetical protein
LPYAAKGKERADRNVGVTGWAFYSIASPARDPDGLKRGDMKKNSTDEGRFTEHGHGIGTVTEKMVLKRARELAVIAGRPEGEPLDSDIAEARRELTGREGLVPKAPRSERLPEDKRWEPVPESEGHQAPTVAASDEQTFAEKLVEEGMEDAEQDLMTRATEESARRDQEEEV